MRVLLLGAWCLVRHLNAMDAINLDAFLNHESCLNLSLCLTKRVAYDLT